MITLRDYQKQAITALLKSPRGICKIPAGGGKTIVGAAAVNEYFRRGNFVMVSVLANTIEQCAQWRTAMDSFPFTQAAQPDIRCFAARSDVSRSEILIIDECHHVAADVARETVARFRGRYLWGFSATPDREDDLHDDVFKIIGPIIVNVHRDQLVNTGSLVRARVKFLKGGDQGEIDDLVAWEATPEIERRGNEIREKIDYWKRATWKPDQIRNRQIDFWNEQLELMPNRVIYPIAVRRGIMENEPRRNLAIQTAANSAHGENAVLILVATIDQGKEIESNLPEGLAQMVHSKIGAKKRKTAIEAFRDGSLKIMIATSLADEGLDVPRANILIMAGAGRSSSKMEQRTGRVLRTWSDKTHGLIYDFWDCQHPFLMAQSRARQRTYRGLGYEIL